VHKNTMRRYYHAVLFAFLLVFDVHAQSSQIGMPPPSSGPCGGISLIGGGGGGGSGASPCMVPYEAATAANTGSPNAPDETGDEGGNTDEPTGGDPVGLISGAVQLSETDIVIPCPHIDLVFMREYDSDLLNKGPLGFRWVHSYGWEIARYKEVNGELGDWLVLRAVADQWQGPYGGTYHWFKKTNGVYSVSDASAYVLTVDQQGEYDVKRTGGVKYHFNTNGVLQNISHPAGSRVDMTYDGQGLLTRVEHSNGKYLSFEYQGQNIARITTPLSNLSVEYSYEDAGMGKIVLAQTLRRTPRGDFALSYKYRKWYDANQVYSAMPAGGGTVSMQSWPNTGGGNASLSPSSDGKADARMVERTDANGLKARYAYRDVDDSRGARASYTVIGAGLYEGSFEYSPGTTVMHNVRGDITQTETFLYNVNQRITGVIGPNTTNFDQRLNWSPSCDVTNAVVKDLAQNKYLMTDAKYGWFHNPTNVAFGYNTVPQKNWRMDWEEQSLLPVKMTTPEGRVFRVDYTNGLPKRFYVETQGAPLMDTVLGYTTNGLLSVVTNANGNMTEFKYDATGYLTNVVPQEGPWTGFRRDTLGYVTNVIMPGESGIRTAAMDVDDRGRLLHVKYPNGHEERLKYNGTGRIIENVDTAGRTGRYDWVFGNLISSERVLTGGVTNQYSRITVTHDKQMNRVNIKDQLGRAVESYVLDVADRVVAVTNLEGQGMAIEYNVADIVKKVTRFDGSEVSFEYSGDGILSSIAYPDSTNSMTYDQDGLLLKVADESGSISNTFNEAGWLTSSKSMVYGLTSMVSFAYYPAGQVSNVVSLAGTNTYTLDSADRLLALRSLGEGGSVEFQNSYNEYNGLISSVLCTNSGISVSNSFSVIDQTTNICWRTSAGSVLADFSYAFNAAQMITQKISMVNGVTNTEIYTMDSLDRLIGEKRMDGQWNVIYDRTFTYDLAGNRLGETLNGTNTTYTLGQGNRLASWTGGGEMLYNAAGCVTTIVYSASNRLDLTWNGQYQLTAVTTNGVVVEENRYDPMGRRVFCSSRSASGTIETNFMVYDGFHTVADVDSTGGVLRSYVWGPGIDNLLAMTVYTGSVAKTYYPITDHLGTVHALVDDAGTVVESYKFDAWGRVLGVFDSSGVSLPSSVIGLRYLWQGREYSFATGLYNFRARWYDSITGRWLSNDPIGINGGLNQYVFCGNNPVNARDPFGLEGKVGVGELLWPLQVERNHEKVSGKIVYDGHDFVGWYAEYLKSYRWTPWKVVPWGDQDSFLEHVDIGKAMEGELFYYEGEYYRADQMGNIAAGYGLMRTWGWMGAYHGSILANWQPASCLGCMKQPRISMAVDF
jgi:RHS repeat-associated protein